MNGPIAQLVALTCHGNAFLDGLVTPAFFPANSTCRFCDRIRFVETRKPLLRKARQVVVAETPDGWIAQLRSRRATGLRLIRTAQDNPGISDRLSAGFVGGGGNWMLELPKPTGLSEFWAARWEVGDKNAPERRVWRVSYHQEGEYRTRPYQGRGLAVVLRDFRASLVAIHAFSAREKCDPFTQLFADALRALDSPEADIGYHKDLAVAGQLAPEAVSLLKAAMSAWVFGGMGSWNDLSFEGLRQQEYELASDGLFGVLNEAIEVAASSSGRPGG